MNIFSKLLFKIYHIVAQTRNSFFVKGIFKTVNVEIPVISVGNISFGGTGKTPMAIWIAKNIQDAGFQPVIISRGYKRRSKFNKIVSDKEKVLISRRAAGDEPYLMAKKLPGVPVIVAKNRVRGAALAKKKFNPRVIILDDAFQHRKIHRDVDIVLIDNPKTLENNIALREPAVNLNRANVVIFTKHDQFEGIDDLAADMVNKYSCSIFKSKFKAVKIVNDTKSYEADYLKGKTVWLVSGIGNPKYFKSKVEELGAHVSKMYTYRDHAKYSRFRVRRIMKKFVLSTADLLLTTEKDWYKFKKWIPKESVCYFLDIDMDIERGPILRKFLLDSAHLSKFEDIEQF